MKKEIQPYPLFPANLLVRDRPCLVVGGGQVASRKTKSLLEAEAAVTIVSPEICEALLMLVEKKTVIHIPREFEENDTNGMFIVFTATDNGEVNQAVLLACRKRSIPCCSVDDNWREGDFVSPASFTKNGVTVSVSTGGQSCTRARDIKNMLEKTMDRFLKQENDA